MYAILILITHTHTNTYTHAYTAEILAHRYGIGAIVVVARRYCLILIGS